jgi:hypothetical protein
MTQIATGSGTPAANISVAAPCRRVWNVTPWEPVPSGEPGPAGREGRRRVVSHRLGPPRGHDPATPPLPGGAAPLELHVDGVARLARMPEAQWYAPRRLSSVALRGVSSCLVRHTPRDQRTRTEQDLAGALRAERDALSRWRHGFESRRDHSSVASAVPSWRGRGRRSSLGSPAPPSGPPPRPECSRRR